MFNIRVWELHILDLLGLGNISLAQDIMSSCGLMNCVAKAK